MIEYNENRGKRPFKTRLDPKQKPVSIRKQREYKASKNDPSV